VNAALDALYPFVRTTHSSDLPAAVQAIANQAFNDFQDLLGDLLDGRGRPAARAARALIEHAINVATVTSNEDAAARYLAHGTIAAVVEADAAIGLNRLRGGDLKAERHRLRKLARRSREVAGHVERYGAGFRRSWSASNLRDRASATGLDDLYDYYRLASMALHGASGGAAATISQGTGRRVHRTGPALAACVPAYHEGIRAFRIIAATLVSTSKHIDGTAVDEVLDAILEDWPVYRAAMLRVDRWLWPKESPAGVTSVLAVSRSGARRWYLWDVDTEMIIEAEPPQEGLVTPQQSATVEQITADALDRLDPRDHWMTITMAGVPTRSKSTGRWMPAHTVLVPHGRPPLQDRPVVH
jgi:hypothetical protein